MAAEAVAASRFCNKLFYNTVLLPLKPSGQTSLHISRSIAVFASKTSSKRNLNTGRGFGKEKSANESEDDDPWEALFQQLENDLENDTGDTDDQDITEEDLQSFEKELEMVLSELASESTSGSGNQSDINNEIDRDTDDEDNSDDDFEEPRKVNLQRWQLKKLAAAAELGRRKVNIKSLAAELKLERDDVLFFLKNPPPELIMIANKMDEDISKVEQQVDDEETEPAGEGILNEVCSDASEEDEEASEIDTSLSVNGIQGLKQQHFGPRDWIKGKRLKKTQLATLQRVYKRTKWPTNAMVQSLVQVTNLPWRRVLEWFEDERSKAGVKEPPKLSPSSRKTWKKPITHSFKYLE